MPINSKRPRKVSQKRLVPRKTAPRITFTETQLVGACLDYLKARKIFAFRLNTGALKTEYGGFVRFGSPGAPDIIVIDNGIFVGLECKVGKNGQSNNQKIFQRKVESAGGSYFIIRSLDDLISKL